MPCIFSPRCCAGAKRQIASDRKIALEVSAERDIQSLSDGRLALIVADVSGKGIGPSLFGASVKASLQVFLHQGLEPGSVLHKTNQFILQGKDNQLFATIFLAILDPLSGQFVYASAGHNRMFQFHLERDIEDLSAKGLPLGIFEGAAYESKTGFIEPGGGLVLYTDGITELVNPQLDLYSLPRLRQFVGQNFHLEPAIFKKSLLLDMDAFRQNCDLADDITCIVMQRSLESL